MNDTKLGPYRKGDGLECRWCGERFKTQRGYRHHRSAVRKYGRAHEDKRDQLTRDYDEGRLGTGLSAELRAIYAPRWAELFSIESPLLSRLRRG